MFFVSSLPNQTQITRHLINHLFRNIHRKAYILNILFVRIEQCRFVLIIRSRLLDDGREIYDNHIREVYQQKSLTYLLDFRLRRPQYRYGQLGDARMPAPAFVKNIVTHHFAYIFTQ